MGKNMKKIGQNNYILRYIFGYIFGYILRIILKKTKKDLTRIYSGL